MRKILTLVLVLVMVMSMATAAFADGTAASITIQNAAKGVTYKAYKLFDATVVGDSVYYTGTIPSALSGYFEKDANGYISTTDAAMNGEEMSDDLKADLKTWAASASTTKTKDGEGGALVFESLPYGYYVISTTQGEQAVSVTPLKANTTIYDKNSSEPHGLVKKVEGKEDDAADVNIGDTVTYTVSFVTSNYSGSGEDAKQIKKYTITDTLPDFLSKVTVNSIKVGETPVLVDGKAPQFDANKQIVLEWADADGNSKYANGATVTITYTAVINEKIELKKANTNSVTVTWNNETGSLTDEDPGVYTGALAILKVNELGKSLDGAKFKLTIKVTGADGTYQYAAADAQGATDTVTTKDGKLVIRGIKPGTEVSIQETEAPEGYNKMEGNTDITISREPADTQTFYLKNGAANGSATDNDATVTYTGVGNAAAIVNKKGTTLPSTGGMGTTMFYVLGIAMVMSAVVLLITKKRMNSFE